MITYTATESKALEKLRETLDEHGLTEKGWIASLGNHKRALGKCNFTRKEITLSREWVNVLPEATIMNTILHETAHALAGPYAKHGPVWKAWARKLGADPNSTTRLSDEQVRMISFKWNGRCDNGHEVGQHRAPMRVKFCTRCPGGIIKDNLIHWNEDGVKVALRDMPKRYRAERERLAVRFGEVGRVH